MDLIRHYRNQFFFHKILAEIILANRTPISSPFVREERVLKIFTIPGIPVKKQKTNHRGINRNAVNPKRLNALKIE